MRAWAPAHLRCPRCRSPLRCVPGAREEPARPRTGVLVCSGEGCGGWYPITRGIPRMLTGALREDVSRFIEPEHRRILADLGREVARRVDPGYDLSNLKHRTMERFGFEWTEYRRFGWDDPVFGIDREEGVFRVKSLLREGDLRGTVVLDAGCGNGRYSHWAARFGGRVFAMDIGDGVEAAAENTGDVEDIQVVQADIFALPFAPGTFDVVFSIGVLMHTGDAERGVGSLARVLRPGGSLSVHLYGRGNAIYELVDRLLRSRTTKRSIPDLLRFTDRAYRLRRWLERAGLARFLCRFVRLDPHPHCIFDWYAAPVATHHTYAEVSRWFDILGLRVVRTNEPPARPRWRRSLEPLIRAADTVTIRGVLG